MASKESLYNTGKNIGRILLAGTAITAAACSVDQKNSTLEPTKAAVAHGQVLTEEEITQIRNYDSFMAAISKVEPTSTVASTPTAEPKTYKVEMLAQAQMTAEGAQLVEKYKGELPNILIKINADVQQTEDLTMYYPIYRAAQDKYGVPWELLWIIHGEESNVSQNPAAYVGNVHYGAMQRAVQFHSIDDRDRANNGLEYLGALPARHCDDAAEIVLAAAEIAEWAGEQKDYRAALLKYSARGPAEERFQKFRQLEALLGQ